MSEATKVADKAVDSIDKITGFAVDQMTALIESVKATTPDAVHGLLEVTRLTAASHIVGGVVSIFVGFVLYKLGWYLWRKFSVWYEEAINREYPNRYDGPPPHIIAGVVWLASGAFLIGGLTETFNFWAWVGVLKPELYLAHQVVEKVMQ